MLSLSPRVRVFVACERVDFRKGFDGLCAIVRDALAEDPLSGHLYLFFNRSGDRVKILLWDRNGFWLFYKRLERGRFEGFNGGEAKVEIDRAKLVMLLDGIDTKKAERRKCFVPEIRLDSRDVDGPHPPRAPR